MHNLFILIYIDIKKVLGIPYFIFMIVIYHNGLTWTTSTLNRAFMKL